MTNVDYGNWVSKRLIYTFYVPGLLLAFLAVIAWPVSVFWFLAGLATLCFVAASYFAYAYYLFSPKGGNIQNQIWDTVINNLDWNGHGKALDIGCGNGAVTIKMAKKFPSAEVTGIDFWGKRWDYSKTVCESNAKAEGVADRVIFQKASASKLPFEDGYFDAAVSNLCFHEVADSKDKREVIREALRVVKKGGVFAFQDLFLLKQVYGEPDELVAAVKGWGVTKVEFTQTRNEPFIPSALKLPFMVGRNGVLKGEK
jgi:SAM-dependent methyltransferase